MKMKLKKGMLSKYRYAIDWIDTLLERKLLTAREIYQGICHRKSCPTFYELTNILRLYPKMGQREMDSGLHRYIASLYGPREKNK
jgi:hypothetical protein